MSSIDNQDSFPTSPNHFQASSYDATQLKMGTDLEMQLGADPRTANQLAMKNLSRNPLHYSEATEASPGRKIDKIRTTTGWIFKSVTREPAKVVTANTLITIIDMIEREAPNHSEAKFTNLVSELSDGISNSLISLANIGHVFSKYNMQVSRQLQKSVYDILSRV